LRILKTVWTNSSDAIYRTTEALLPPDALGSSATVLVAEANADNRIVIELLLRRLGHRPLVVNDGAEAWNALQTQHVDLAILDLSLPGIDGLTLARRIQIELTFPPKLIALTASTLDSDRTLCTEAGFAEFLSKPLRDSDLRRVLQTGENEGAPRQGAKDVWCMKNLTSFLTICGVKADPMIRTVLDDTSSWLDMAILQQSDERIAARAHKLAGSAMLIGALHLAASLTAIETVASTGSKDLAQALEIAKQACIVARRELPACVEAACGEIAGRPHR